MRLLLSLICLILLSACNQTANKTSAVNQIGDSPDGIIRDKEPQMTGSFDPISATYVLKPGTATIKGLISAKGRDSRQYNGTFAKVRLIPETVYAREYIEKLFRGGKVYRWGATVGNLDKRFRQTMRYTTADKDGNYTFFGVPQGSYYVYATVPIAVNYFAIYARVTIAKGQIMELPLNDK